MRKGEFIKLASDSSNTARMKIKKDDYVSIQAGTVLENGEVVHDWAGQVAEVYPKEATCLITLDAPSIDSLSDEYILDCLELGAEPFQYVFGKEELVPHPRRDTDEEFRRAIDQLVDRELKLEEQRELTGTSEEDEYEKLKVDWTERFLRSEQYQALSEAEQEQAGFAVEMFMHYLHSYEDVLPKQWDVLSISNVCLEWVPAKVSTEAAFFEHFGDVVIAFLQYLGQAGEIGNATTLISAVKKVKKRIPERAANPANWGMAKSMVMGAQDAGVDTANEADLFSYMSQLRDNRLNEAFASPKQPSTNPYKHLGRNDKVTVRYPDGRVLSDVKFKKVMKDLQGGNCELVE